MTDCWRLSASLEAMKCVDLRMSWTTEVSKKPVLGAAAATLVATGAVVASVVAVVASAGVERSVKTTTTLSLMMSRLLKTMLIYEMAVYLMKEQRDGRGQASLREAIAIQSGGELAKIKIK